MPDGSFEFSFKHGNDAICRAEMQIVGQWQGHAERRGVSAQDPLEQRCVGDTDINPFGQIANKNRGTFIVRAERTGQFVVCPEYFDSGAYAARSESLRELQDALARLHSANLLAFSTRQRILVSFLSGPCQGKRLLDQPGHIIFSWRS